MKEKNLAIRVSVNSIVINALLSAGKLASGLLASSGAMISDAIHSASDVLSTFVVIIGMRLAGKPSDAEHPYGHERMESVASVVLAVILCLTGLSIGWSGIQKIFSAEKPAAPGALALVAAGVSIAVKEWMYWYTRAAAKKLHSCAMMADAWHHRSDALSSVGSFVGVLGARLGLPILDPIASVVICVFIVKAAVDIFRDGCDQLVDHACPEETVEQMRRTILSVPGVSGVDDLKSRRFGSKLYADVEISAPGDESLSDAHATAQAVHDAMEAGIPQLKHCTVHVNPEKVVSADAAPVEAALVEDAPVQGDGLLPQEPVQRT